MRPSFVTLLVSLCIAACAGSATAKSTTPPVHLNKIEKKVLRWIEAHNDEQIELLEQVVNINSGSMNLAGVRKVGEIYAAAFAAIGMETSWVDLPEEMHRAGHLIARTRPTAPNKGKRIVLIGHLDTVFEESSPFQSFSREGHIARGPGTVDMKGGNGVILFALSALHAAGLLDHMELTVILTGDEEKPGKPLATTRQALIDAVKQADVALGFESLVDHMDTATIARRGFLGWTLRVQGSQGHSSLIFSPNMGYGAIYEAARILDGFRLALAGQENLSFSPGRIVGGTQVHNDDEKASASATGKANIIAREVVAIGDLRALTAEQVASTQEAMQAIVANHLPGTGATLVFEEGYPPMAPSDDNRALFAVANQVNLDMGRQALEAVPPMRRGAADISFAAPYVASMGGMGLLGDGDHSPKELADLRSIPVATGRAALLLYRLSQMPRAD